MLHNFTHVIVHNCSNLSNEWQKKYFLSMVEFGKKMGQGRVDSIAVSLFLNPNYSETSKLV